MLSGKIRGWLGLIIFVISLIILMWGIIPYQKEVREIPLSPADIQLHVLQNLEYISLPFGFISQSYDARAHFPSSFLSLSIPENRLITFIFPQKMRVGDSDNIQLTFGIDSLENGESEEISPLAFKNSEYKQNGNIFDSYHVIAEARLEMSSIEYLPTGDISEALLPAIPVTFLWNIRSRQAGLYQGTVWLHLVFVPKAGGQDIRQVLTAQRMNIEMVDLFGLDGRAARILGIIGIILGIMLGLEYFLDMAPKKSIG